MPSVNIFFTYTECSERRGENKTHCTTGEEVGERKGFP